MSLAIDRDQNGAIQEGDFGVGLVDGVAKDVECGARHWVRAKIVGLELCQQFVDLGNIECGKDAFERVNGLENLFVDREHIGGFARGCELVFHPAAQTTR